MARRKSPDIFAYTDYRAYLGDWLDVPPRSLRWLGDRVHCSKSLIQGILKGTHKLHRPRAEVFVNKALKLDEDEARHFYRMVAYCDAETDKARLEAWRDLRGHQRYRAATSVEEDMAQLFSRWWIPAVLELVRTEGFRADPEWIAARLGRRISAEHASDAVDLLLRIGGVAFDEQGNLAPGDDAFVTQHEVSNETVARAVTELHGTVLGLAGEALAELAPERRYFGNTTIAVPEDKIGELKAEIERFQERMVGMCHPEGSAPTAVVQLSVQLFPWTNPEEAQD